MTVHRFIRHDFRHIPWGTKNGREENVAAEDFEQGQIVDRETRSQEGGREEDHRQEGGPKENRDQEQEDRGQEDGRAQAHHQEGCRQEDDGEEGRTQEPVTPSIS